MNENQNPSRPQRGAPQETEYSAERDDPRAPGSSADELSERSDADGRTPDFERFDGDIAEGDEVEHGGSTGRGHRGRASHSVVENL